MLAELSRLAKPLCKSSHRMNCSRKTRWAVRQLSTLLRGTRPLKAIRCESLFLVGALECSISVHRMVSRSVSKNPIIPCRRHCPLPEFAKSRHEPHRIRPCRCSADFQVGCIADFQIRRDRNVQTALELGRAADLEIGDTAGLETCATSNFLRAPHFCFR